MMKTDKLSLEEMIKLVEKVKNWKLVKNGFDVIYGIKANINNRHIYIGDIFSFRKSIFIQSSNYDVIGSYKGFDSKLRNFLYNTISKIQNKNKIRKNERIKKGIDYIRGLIK